MQPLVPPEFPVPEPPSQHLRPWFATAWPIRIRFDG
jgi:hypothetical protein